MSLVTIAKRSCILMHYHSYSYSQKGCTLFGQNSQLYFFQKQEFSFFLASHSYDHHATYINIASAPHMHFHLYLHCFKRKKEKKKSLVILIERIGNWLPNCSHMSVFSSSSHIYLGILALHSTHEFAMKSHFYIGTISEDFISNKQHLHNLCSHIVMILT